MDQIDFSKVGLKMKQMRAERGITQEKVAKDLDCTIAFISNVENARAKLNLRVLLYYSWLCHVPVDTFLNAGRTSIAPENEQTLLCEEILKVFRTFSPEKQEKIIQTLKIWAAECQRDTYIISKDREDS